MGAKECECRSAVAKTGMLNRGELVHARGEQQDAAEDHVGRDGCFFREVLLIVSSSLGKHDLTWIPGLCWVVKHVRSTGTWLTEAIRGNCTPDLKQSW